MSKDLKLRELILAYGYIGGMKDGNIRNLLGNFIAYTGATELT